MKILRIFLFLTLDTINDLLWEVTYAIDNVLVRLAAQMDSSEDDPNG